MAALQQTSISSQSKTLAAQALRSLFIHKPSNLSFSSTFPSLNISTAQHRSLIRGSGVRMTASTAISYASALAEVARSNGTLDATCADVEKIEKFFTDPQVFDFFINPTVELEKKRQFLDEIAATAALHPHTVNFINILVEAQRIDLIEEIVKEFEIVYNSLTNTELVVVSSVVKLEVDQLSQISKQVQKLTGAKNVRMKSVIDPSLVAGFTIRYGSSGSRLIDMSVKKQLEDIAAQLDLGDIKLVA